jgi:hypothetical protein
MDYACWERRHLIAGISDLALTRPGTLTGSAGCTHLATSIARRPSRSWAEVRSRSPSSYANLLKNQRRRWRPRITPQLLQLKTAVPDRNAARAMTVHSPQQIAKSGTTLTCDIWSHDRARCARVTNVAS